MARLFSISDLELLEPVLNFIELRAAHDIVAKCQASNSPREPRFEHFGRFPLTTNDEDVTDRVSDAFAGHFGEHFHTLATQSGSEDFSEIANVLGASYRIGLTGARRHWRSVYS